MALNPDNLTKGSSFTLGGDTLNILGTITTAEADHFLLVSVPDEHAVVLVNRGTALEEGEEAQETSPEDTPQASVSDVTDVPDARDPSPSQPTDTTQQPGTDTTAQPTDQQNA
jgi:hypothetical protein